MLLLVMYLFHSLGKNTVLKKLKHYFKNTIESLTEKTKIKFRFILIEAKA